MELAGNTWRGNQLDVQTTNGGIHVNVPESYSARFETSTVNGGVHSDLPGADVAKSKREPKRVGDLRLGRTARPAGHHEWRHTFGQIVRTSENIAAV